MLRKQNTVEAKRAVKSDLSIVALSVNISSSAQYKEISDRIDNIGMNFAKSIDISQFELEDTKQKLKRFLDSEYMQENLKFFQENAGIYYVANNESLPNDKVCIQIKCDEKKLPVYLVISFNSDLSNSKIIIDLIHCAEKLKNIKESNLTYLNNINDLSREVELITEQIPGLSFEEITQVISGFNKEWKGQLEMTYDGDVETFSIKDTQGNVLYDRTVRRNQQNEPQHKQPIASLVNNYANFWQRNSIRAATALTTAGLLVGATAFYLTRRR